MEVLLEIREAEELAALNEHIDLVGVNNRDLKNFQVDVARSFELSGLIPQEFIKVSESGIDSAATIYELKEAGYKGFLIGSAFMEQSRPELSCASLVRELLSVA
jgi:indole-3-glycerol phosphate synthase